MTAALALFLALLLGISAVHKLFARVELGPVAARLAGVHEGLGSPLLFAAAAIEAFAALALMVPALSFVGALAAALLWTGYALALWRRRGEALDCGCDLVRRVRPITGLAAARPLFLAAIATGLAFAPAPVLTLETPFAAAALLALWFAAAELAAIPTWRLAR